MIKRINRERLFFISYVIFLIGILINETKYNFIPVALKVSHVIQLVGCGLAIIKILLDVYEMFKSKKKIVINYKWILFYIISFIVMIFTKSKIVVYLPLFVLAAKDINFDKILKYTLYTFIFMMLFTLISFFSGVIVEITLERGGTIRHSFGWTSANQLMIIVFEMIAIFLYLRRNKLCYQDFIISILLLLISYYYTNSRMSFICSIFLIILFALVRYTNISKLFEKLKVLVYALPIVLAIMAIGTTILFSKIDLSKLDDILTGRLFFGNEAIKEYGIKPFGSEIKYYGQRAEGEMADKSYNYIDSSYLKSLVNYGYFYFIISMILIIVLTKYAYSIKDYYLLMIIIAIDVFVTIDSFLLCIELNPWLILLVNNIYPLEIIGNKKKKYAKI